MALLIFSIRQQFIFIAGPSSYIQDKDARYRLDLQFIHSILHSRIPATSPVGFLNAKRRRFCNLRRRTKAIMEKHYMSLTFTVYSSNTTSTVPVMELLISSVKSSVKVYVSPSCTTVTAPPVNGAASTCTPSSYLIYQL